MKLQTTRGHMSGFLFTLALFFVFAASSVTVLLISSGTYSKTAVQTEANYNMRTALTYIAQKIRQSDSGGSISIGKLENMDALLIRQTYDNSSYTTYIYVQEGTLKELFIKDGSSVSPESGQPLLELDALAMEETENGLFRFTATNTGGESFELLAAPRSTEGRRF